MRVTPPLAPVVNAGREQPASRGSLFDLARGARFCPHDGAPRSLSLDLSDALRARIIWFAWETGQDVDVALATLLDFFLESREQESTIETLAAILRLSEQLELAQVDVETLNDYLKTLEQLRKKNCDFTDVPEALRLITALEALPISWGWDEAESALQAVAAILEGGIALADVIEFLEHHRRLGALGFDEAMAVEIAEALTRAGATGERRDAVLDTLVEVAGQHVNVEDLKDEQERLEPAVKRLRAEEAAWKTRIQRLDAQITGLRETGARLHQTNLRLQAKCDEADGALAAAEALRAFLLRRTADAERLWASLELLLDWRRRGGRADDSIGQLWTKDIHHKILEFFQKLLLEVQKP